MEQFSFRLDDVWKLVLPVIGARRETAYILVDDESLTFRFGWFEERVPLSEIAGVETMPWPWYFGVGMRLAPGRTLGLVGSTQEVVALTLREPRQIKVPFKMTFERIAASVENHKGFIEALERLLESRRAAPR